MTLVMVLQVLFPLLGGAYLVSAWRHRDDVLDASDVSNGFHPVLLGRSGRGLASRRCHRSRRRAIRVAPRSRIAFERLPVRRG